MSQADKKVSWCLQKAKKEIEECKKLRIRPRHRGLIKTEINIEEARKHIEKAEYNLKSGIDFKKMTYSDWSINAFFYSLYHCFLSIASRFGYESGNQNCTIALIEHLKEQGKINLDKKFICSWQRKLIDFNHQMNLPKLQQKGLNKSKYNEYTWI